MRRTTSTRPTSDPPSNGSTRRSDLTGLAGGGLLATLPDARLVELARRGDEGAFGAIVERYRAPLLRYCLGFVPPAAAEDALQQTFINAHAALTRDDGRAPVSLRPWLYRVAHNAALNVARDPQAGLAELPEDLDGVERPDEALQRRERFARVVGAVRALPPRQRQVIVRHALEGESHERIAADLGMSAGAIRQLAHRARRTVREAAAGWLPVPVLRWLPFGSNFSEAAPVVGGGGAVAAVKVALSLAVVAGASGGAIEATQHEPSRRPARSHTAAVVPGARTVARTLSPAPVRSAPAAVSNDTARSRPVRDDSSRHDSSGRGSDGSSSSGPSDSSGPGPSGSSDSDSGTSGSGSSGSSGSGSGSSGSSGPGPSDSSGSGSAGSGSSGSGSSNSGPGSAEDAVVTPTPTPVATVQPDNSGPGSTSSGSGSSGSGSDDTTTDDHSGHG
jgi:RNA polymerase sigma factor (sigma-70 family)